VIDARAFRRFAVAAAASGAVHAIALSYGRIELPEAPADLPPLAVKLEHVNSPPAAAPQPKPRANTRVLVARAKPAAPPIALPPTQYVESQEAAESGSEEASIVTAPPEPTPEPIVVATAPTTTLDVAPPALPAFPRSGRITYTLVYGADQFPVGRTTQQWKIEGTRYQLASRSETTGLIDFFRPQHRTYLSRGELTPAGLRPETFLMSRDRGRGIEEARAQFDWRNASVTLGPVTAQRAHPLPPDAQDLLSFIYQLAIDPPSVGRHHVSVTNGTRLASYVLDVLPEQKIETPLGVLRALPIRQVRSRGIESVDVWLATEYRHLPVRVRFYGRDGEPAGEQIVSEIRLADE